MNTVDNPNPEHNSRKQLDILCWLLEQAFDSQSTQALIFNLTGLHPEDWTALPPGGGRTIASILEHVGWSKWMYEDYAFGPATLRGDQPPMVPPNGVSSRPVDELLQWLKEGHHKWLASVRALADDSELDKPRLLNWGEMKPTRDIIRIQISHDFYHAGEINHLRALLQGNDRWEYD